ncbi:MAG: type II secretion system F family protein [Desulfobacterales bacterium]|nr:type II secretion system F family protein [Desulfobacterales bacterium]
MPNYRYRAIDAAGRLSRGTAMAFSEADIEERLRQKGLTLVESRQVSANAFSGLVAGGRIKPRLLIELYHRLAQTLELGLPILSALEENARLLPSKALRKILNEVHMAIEGGSPLFDSMSRFPKVFSKLDLGIVKMGEQSGVLPKCLKDLANFREWKENIKSILRRATIYPSFVVTAILAVIGVWVGYVLPQMAVMLTDMGVALPGITRLVLQVSLFARTHWPWLLGLALAVPTVIYLLQKTPRGGIVVHRLLLRVPLAGKIAGNIALARLCHNFATMYRAGMNISNIFEILMDHVLGNRYLEDRLTRAFREIQLGQPIAGGFEKAGGFPPLFLGGIRNGETTGSLDDAFKRLGDYYDQEVKRTVQALVSALEPMSILLLGGVFGLIVLSILLPLYDVIGQFGQAY